MPQIDHRVGDGFQRIVQFADALETQQQSLELVFPTEDSLNGVEALFEDGEVKELLGPALCCLSATWIGVDVGSHSSIENGLSIDPAIVGTVQANDDSPQAKTNGFGDSFELRQCFSKHGGLILIAWRRHQWNNHIAVSVTEDDHLVALEFLVTTEANVVASLLCRGGGAIAVQDANIKMTGLLQSKYRVSKHGVDAASACHLRRAL